MVYISKLFKKNISKYIRIDNIKESISVGISIYKGTTGNISVSIQPNLLLYVLSNYRSLFGSSSGCSIGDRSDLPYNRIVFGAPGTGKSYKLHSDSAVFHNNIERVTFHPNYSYGQFIGTYKPISIDGSIRYTFVPGPFIRTYINCLKDPSNNYLLIIEEINRANVSAVFGDIFQLLDRKDGISEYPITTGEDLKDYLYQVLYPNYDQFDDNNKKVADLVCSHLCIPQNMYIWATMNSSDQGVFTLDTAFKRRWNFEYIGIDDCESTVDDRKFNLPDGTSISWPCIRRIINDKLLATGIVNEDKLLGPFFINNYSAYSDEEFNSLIKSKIIMYIFEDISKYNRSEIFSGCDKLTYSSICEKFDEIGLNIFNNTS